MRRSIVAAAVLMLVACGGRGEGGNEQTDTQDETSEGAGAARAGMTLQPGQWEVTVQVASMNMPNMPAGVEAPTPPATTIRTCLTPEQVRQPDADFFTGAAKNSGCTYENMSMREGRMQGTVQCNMEGSAMRSSFEGRFSPTSYELTQHTQMSGQGMEGMEMESRITGRRVGDCPAT